MGKVGLILDSRCGISVVDDRPTCGWMSAIQGLVRRDTSGHTVTGLRRRDRRSEERKSAGTWDASRSYSELRIGRGRQGQPHLTSTTCPPNLHLEQLPALILVRHCAVRPLPARVTCQWSCRQQARREISLAGRSAQAWVSGEYPEPEPSALGQNRLRWAGVRDCRERTSCGCAPNDRRMTPVGRQTKLGAAQAMSCCFKRKDSIDAIFAYAACWLVLLQP